MTKQDAPDINFNDITDPDFVPKLTKCEIIEKFKDYDSEAPGKFNKVTMQFSYTVTFEKEYTIEEIEEMDISDISDIEECFRNGAWWDSINEMEIRDCIDYDVIDYELDTQIERNDQVETILE